AGVRRPDPGVDGLRHRTGGPARGPGVDPAAGRGGAAGPAPPKDAALDGPRDAFEVELAGSGTVLAVPADRSALEVIEDAGIFVLSSCREGTCGDRAADHRTPAGSRAWRRAPPARRGARRGLSVFSWSGGDTRISPSAPV